jgi:hypothetical protein
MHRLRIALLVGLLVVSTSAAVNTAPNKAKVWSFEGSFDQVFEAAARAGGAQRWKTGLTDRMQGFIRFGADGMDYEYLVSLHELRPGVVQVSLMTIKGHGVYAPAVSGEMAEQFFTQVQWQLNPATEAPVQLGKSGQNAFGQYLLAAGDKAFACSPTGHFGYSTKRRSKKEAMDRALEFCRQYAEGERCELVMVNDLKVGK